MISILIPIYNYNCSDLICDLSSQRKEFEFPCEIILLDDASTLFKKKNEMAALKNNCTYIELPDNIGRSAIRNKLASMATYEWLIFLDCDSRIPDGNFLNRYLEEVRITGRKVMCGGSIYHERSSISEENLFHWTCGSVKEPNARSAHKNKHFLSNNFLINRDLFNEIRFEEGLREYGHEDTLFGVQLKKKGIQIHYADNPVYHEGLERTDLFIAKYKKAIFNLKILKEKFLEEDEVDQIRILSLHKKLERVKADHLLAFLYRKLAPLAERQFKSKKPNLILFDLYKLGFLCSIMLSDRQPLQKSDHG